MKQLSPTLRLWTTSAEMAAWPSSKLPVNGIPLSALRRPTESHSVLPAQAGQEQPQEVPSTRALQHKP